MSRLLVQLRGLGLPLRTSLFIAEMRCCCVMQKKFVSAIGQTQRTRDVTAARLVRHPGPLIVINIRRRRPSVRRLNTPRSLPAPMR